MKKLLNLKLFYFIFSLVFFTGNQLSMQTNQSDQFAFAPNFIENRAIDSSLYPTTRFFIPIESALAAFSNICQKRIKQNYQTINGMLMLPISEKLNVPIINALESLLTSSLQVPLCEQQQLIYNLISKLSSEQRIKILEVADELDIPIIIEPALDSIADFYCKYHFLSDCFGKLEQLPISVQRKIIRKIDQKISLTDRLLFQIYAEKQDLIKPIKKYSLNLNQIAFFINTRGQQVLSSTSDNTILISDLENKNQSLFFTKHKRKINSCAFNKDNNLFVTCSDDNTISLWSINGHHLRNFQGHEAPKIAAFSTKTPHIVSYGKDKIIKIWNIDTGEHINKFTQCKLLSGSTAASRFVAYHKQTKEIFIFDTELSNNYKISLTHTDQPKIAAFNNNGSCLAIGYKDGTLEFFDAKSLQSIKTIKRHDSAITNLLFSPDDKLLISSDKKGIISLNTGHFGLSLQKFSSDDYSIKLAFNKEGNELYISNTKDLHVFDLSSLLCHQVDNLTTTELKQLIYSHN